MMEKVEIPTIYFTPPKRQRQRHELTLGKSNIEFWNNFSQSQRANTTPNLSTSDNACRPKKVSCHSKRKCCHSVTNWENDVQSDHNSSLHHPHLNPIRPSRSHQNRGSKVKLKLQLKWHQVLLLISLFILSLFCQVSEECPQACECKWKGGKESVICANGKTKLTAIPIFLEPGTQLLDLSKNNIVSLQSKVFHSLNLLNLQKIFLSDCNLKTLDKNVFYKLNNLVELDLSGNKLDSIPTHTFDQIPELRELKLNSNPVTRISSNSFASLTRLVRLDLSKCRIRSIDSAAFRNLVSLEWLKLNNNRLVTINVVSFYPLRNLHGLEIHENPWNCSCTLQPLRDWMSKNNVPYGIPPICDQPPRLSSKSWDQLQREDFACLPKVQSSVLAETGELTKSIEGENATLVCRLQATPDTQVRWMNGKKPVAISSSSSSRYSLSESFVVQGSSGGDGEKATPLPNTSTPFSGAKQTLGTKTSVLTVIRTKLRDSGIYSCTANSRAGSVSANFTLQVLQLSAEHLSGRFLLYGATVSALLILSFCLLLLVVVFFCGKVKSSSPITPNKIELNNVPNHGHQNGGRLLQNGHTRNGRTSIPLLQEHNNHNGTPPNYRPNTSILSNFSIVNPNRRPNPDGGRSTANNNGNNPPPPGRGLLNPHYKVLPTNDDPNPGNHDDNDIDEEPDLDSSGSDLEGGNESRKSENFPTCSKRNSKVLSVPVPETAGPITEKRDKVFPDLLNEEKSPQSTSHQRNAESSITMPQNMQLSVRPKALLPSNNPIILSSVSTQSSESTPPIATNSHRRPPDNSSEPEDKKHLTQPHPHPTPIPHNQFSPPKTIPNGTPTHNPSSALKGPGVSANTNHANSKNDYVPSQTMVHSSPPTFTKFTFTQQRPTPPIPAPRHQRTFSFTSGEAPTIPPRPHQNPNHISFYRQSQSQSGQYYSAGVRKHPPHPFQRRSMPTSPIHQATSSYQYDSHYAAYNHGKGHTQGSDPGLINQHEFVGQSQEYDYHAAQLAAFLEEYRQLQMELMRMSASLTEMDPNQPSNPSSNGPNSNINLNSIDPMTQTQRGGVTNVNADFHQQQFKSILKSSGPNNNYLV